MATTIAITMAMGSCTGTEPDEGADGSRSQPATSGTTSKLDRFEQAAEPLWRGDAGGLPEIMTAGWLSARFIDDVLLLEQGNSPMAVVNPITGEPYWTADSELLVGNSPKYGDVELFNSTGRAPIVRIGDEWATFVSYITGDNTEGAQRETQIAAVRVKDASALWKAPSPDRSYEIVDADERKVLLSIGARLDTPVARAISTANGSTLWETQSVWAQFVAGDRVLGAVSSQPPELEADDSYVVGLDAATGQHVWSLDGRYRRSEVGFVVGDVALVYARPTSGGDSDQEKIVLIDLESGAEIVQLGWEFGAKTSCAGDGSRLIACTLDEKPEKPGIEGNRLVTYDVARRAKYVSPPEQEKEVSRFSVKKIWGDYLFVDGSSTIDDWWAVDRDGIAVSDELPGKLTGISEEYAAFALPDRSIPAIYQLKK